MLKIIRAILGTIILIADRLFTPQGITRELAQQQAIDAQTAKLTLYQFEACPFCVKVRRAMKRLSLNIALKDAQNDPIAREELLKGGGQLQVPCLRIQKDDGSIQWMYESSDIIAYLTQL